MTDKDKQLLAELVKGSISTDFFNRNFSVNINTDITFVREEVKTAMGKKEPEEIEQVLHLIWASSDITKYVDLLNILLIDPHHRIHQQIVKALQDSAPNASTIPFVRKALETNFDYLAYSGSDSAAIAKWFSWLLYAIGSTEAIDLMKEYSYSTDKGISDEMLYRLKRMQH